LKFNFKTSKKQEAMERQCLILMIICSMFPFSAKKCL
jgi:hypothetical protein